jgi:hypothetical protein
MQAIAVASQCRYSPQDGPSYIYVDNSSQTASFLQEVFPSVKKVIEDSTHFMRRYMRTLTPGHPLNGKS